MCLAQGHNTVTLVRLEPGAPRSRVKHSTTAKKFESKVVHGVHSNIRIYQECEGRIDKSVLRITDWNQDACQEMTKGDCDGRIFLSYRVPSHDKWILFLAHH